MTRLDEIRARLDAATPGPWRVVPAQDINDGPSVVGGNGPLNAEFVCETACDEEGIGAADAALIAHAPDDLRLLLAVAEAADAFVAQYELEKTWHGDAEFPAAEYHRLRAAAASLNGEPA